MVFSDLIKQNKQSTKKMTCLWTYCFFGIILSAAFAREIAFEPCGGVVKSVDVSPCEEEPCAVPKGSSAEISVKCVSNVDAEKLRLLVFADIQGSEVPYPGMKRDACKGKNLTCPITKSQEFGYIQKFEVKKFFPTIETKARFTLVTDDEQDETVCCFITPVKVV